MFSHWRHENEDRVEAVAWPITLLRTAFGMEKARELCLRTVVSKRRGEDRDFRPQFPREREESSQHDESQLLLATVINITLEGEVSFCLGRTSKQNDTSPSSVISFKVASSSWLSSC